MPDVDASNWSDVVEAEDYQTALQYLSLLLPDDAAKRAVEALRNAPLVRRQAKDLLRASNLDPLPGDNPDVASKLKKLKKGRLLTPVLLLRGDLRRRAPLTIADGYHRISASYILDEKAEIPCKLAELPGEETI
ncbi:MAG TPA: hypothetical protein VKU86_02715 [Acidimicrobiales bacterium]|nr:hypothetical protein [Acidimicrobiales bacterium]